MIIDVHILTTHQETSRYVEAVQNASDSNKESFGFTPASQIAEAAERNRLWVAIKDDGSYMGHLLFGGKYPTVRVRQLHVCPEFRKTGVARSFIEELAAWAEDRKFSIVLARVAADLEANAAWAKLGFQLVSQEKGGKTTGRLINNWVRELDCLTLFKFSEDTNQLLDASGGIQYSDKPILSSPNYTLDVNVVFDALKSGRKNAQVVRKLISLSFATSIRLVICEEFIEELKRQTNSYGEDPLLTFCRALPRLPRISEEVFDGRLRNLAPSVFPSRRSIGELKENERSDLIHLCSSIHHGVTGFITSDSAVLREADRIFRAHNLEVIPPGDLLDALTAVDEEAQDLDIAISTSSHLRVSQAAESARPEIERFLNARVGAQSARPIWDPGSTVSPRRRIIMREDDRLIGVASWSLPSRQDVEFEMYLVLDENTQSAIRAIDHVFALAQRDAPTDILSRQTLRFLATQTLTRQTATQRGYRGMEDRRHGNLAPLVKLTYSGLIDTGNWASFRDAFQAESGLALPNRLPTFREGRHTGFVLRRQRDNAPRVLGLFELETLLSPALFALNDRTAIVVPIRRHFAQQLLGADSAQREMLPGVESQMHSESAYYRSPKNHRLFEKGTIVFFYESGQGGGSMEVIGHGRITSTGLYTPTDAHLRFGRQGVLPIDELKRIAKGQQIHAFTFDNFVPLRRRIEFRRLKEENLVSGANLVTAQKLGKREFQRVLDLGYGESS